MLATQVLEAVVERVQDFEEKVRSKAIGAICEAAVSHPEVYSRKAIRVLCCTSRDSVCCLASWVEPGDAVSGSLVLNV